MQSVRNVLHREMVPGATLRIGDICMSSFDHRQSSATNGLQIPGLVNELSPANQLPFPDSAPPPGKTTRRLEHIRPRKVTQAITDPGTTRDLSAYFTSPNITRVL